MLGINIQPETLRAGFRQAMPFPGRHSAWPSRDGRNRSNSNDGFALRPFRRGLKSKGGSLFHFFYQHPACYLLGRWQISRPQYHDSVTKIECPEHFAGLPIRAFVAPSVTSGGTPVELAERTPLGFHAVMIDEDRNPNTYVGSDPDYEAQLTRRSTSI
jgi:hypothetical protein